MIDILAGQHDYVSFTHGLAFLLVATTARALAGRADRLLAWNWLAASALGAGLSGLLDVLAVALGPLPALPPLRFALMLVACVSLLQCCRVSGRAARWSPGWMLASVAAVGAAAALGGPAAAEAALRYGLGFPSAAWAAWVLARRYRHGGEPTLMLSAAGFALVALATGLTGPPAAFLPASVYNDRVFAAVTHVPVDSVRMVAALLLAVSLWRHYCVVRLSDELRASAFEWRRYETGLAAATALVLAGGWAFTQMTAAAERSQSETNLRARAAAVAAMFPPGAIDQMVGGPGDPPSGTFADAAALLYSVCAASPDVVSASIIGRRGDALVYLADAIPEARRRAGDRPATPGDPYDDPTGAAAGLLRTARPAGPGPRQLEDDAAVSQLVPIGVANGRAPAILNLTIDPAERREAVACARLTPILLTLVTSLLLIASFVFERRMAESTACVAASERRYRSLVEGSPDGVMLLDREGRCLTINHNGLAIFSRRQGDLVGHPLSDLWPDADRSQVVALTGRALSGERVTLDTRYTTPDGGVTDLEIVINPVADGDGHVSRMVGIVSDVGERRRTQAALERSHRFTQVVLGISARFLNLRPEGVDAATRQALREVGDFLGVDRAQLFHLSPDRTTFSLTHEWCVAGIESRISALQAVSVAEYPWILSTLEQSGPVLVSDVARMPPEAAAERVRMAEQGLGAFLCVPVHRHGRVTGVLAFGAFRRRDWPADEVALLRIVADVLSSGLARKMADEALRDSELRFRRAFRANPAAMTIVWAETQRIVEVNNAFLELVDRPIEDVVGRSLDEIHLIDGDPDRERLLGALSAGEPLHHLDLRIKTGRGDVRHVSLSMERFELAGQRFMLAVALDLSARVQAEEALRDREEIFRSISAAAQDGIIMIDSDARVTVWNEAAERMFGFSREEATGQPLYGLILPDDYQPGFMEGFGNFRRSGEGPFIGSAQAVLAQRKDGTQIPVELSTSAVNVHGRWHAVGILRDITERLKVDEELWKAKEESEAANAELQRSVERANRLADEAAVANASKSEFVANMSHEIRTPMNGIIGMTGLLLDTPLDPDQREYAATVRSCADSLLTIINDILDFSKIEAGKLDLETLDFDLAATLEDTIDVLAIRARQKGLNIGWRIDPAVPTRLRGDPGRLRQILMNLTGNSLKFTERGEVAVDVAAESVHADQAMLRFVVRDTGIGIPAGKADKLFQPFTQVDASTTRRFGGTGLGLSISRRLAEMMGGTIGVESEEGVGSRFWFTARFELQPAHAAGIAPGVEHPAPADAPCRKARVLLAEDNVTNQKVAIKVLEKMGHRVDAVANGVEAIKALRTIPYDLVFMDVQMPEMDGFEATRLIRDPQTGVRDPRIPVVAMTAHAMKGDRERCLEAGMDDYVSKPISPQAVAAAIARRLQAIPAPGPLAPEVDPAPVALEAGAAAAPASPPDSGLPDRQALLDRLGGDECVFIEVIKIFLEDAPKQLEGLDEALAAGDAKTLRRLAHTLKGSSGTAGAVALQQASLRLEEAAAAGDLAAAAPLIPPVKQLFASVLETMGAWVAGENVS